VQRAAQSYAGRVTVLGVDQSEAPSTVQAFVAQQKLTLPVPLDSAGRTSSAYGVRALPTTFFIDRDGVIRQIQVGPLTEATLEQLLQTIYP
jgi:cytochrome c biogenesis protein CcmG/thiol:disulfide interchange protein DsbE